jgi:hypothetical protein
VRAFTSDADELCEHHTTLDATCSRADVLDDDLVGTDPRRVADDVVLTASWMDGW